MLQRRILTVALYMGLGSQVYAQTCGELCTGEFWDTSTPEQISEAIRAEDVNARDKYGSAPIHAAAASSSPKGVIDLIKAGAEINARGYQGETALHKAIRGFIDFTQFKFDESTGLATGGKSIVDLEVIDYLIQSGADLNARTEYGSTPLHRAVSENHEAMLRLLKAGADVNARDDSGVTPFHKLSQGGSIQHVTAFLDAGADVNARDEDGRTPLHFAAIWPCTHEVG